MQIAGTRLPIWLAIFYLLALLSILAWPISAFVSLFFGDDPHTPLNQVLVMMGVAVCYPILPLTGVPGSFLAFKRGWKMVAYVLAGIAALPAAAIALILISGMVMDAMASTHPWHP